MSSLIFPQFQVKLDELEKELQELNSNAERLGRSHAELLELQLVLEVASQFFSDAQHSASRAQSDRVDAFGGGESCCHLHLGGNRINPAANVLQGQVRRTGQHVAHVCDFFTDVIPSRPDVVLFTSTCRKWR